MTFLDLPLLEALWLSFQLAGLTTVILLVFCTPLAWWLARSRSIFAAFIEACVSLPLVLPPTVLGFYLLIFLSPQSTFGGWWLSLTDQRLVFSFAGLVIGSCIYSLPFVVRPLMAGFAAVDPKFLEAAATMRAGGFDRFRSIVLPLCKPAYLSALVLGFAHTLGEFGVVLMLGGNIAGETRTISIAIYDAVEQMDYNSAHQASALMLAICFLILAVLFTSERFRRGRVI